MLSTPGWNNEARFAPKGATAIHLVVRDCPRLSVDIELVYLPIEDRPTTADCKEGHRFRAPQIPTQSIAAETRSASLGAAPGAKGDTRGS